MEERDGKSRLGRQVKTIGKIKWAHIIHRGRERKDGEILGKSWPQGLKELGVGAQREEGPNLTKKDHSVMQNKRESFKG